MLVHAGAWPFRFNLDSNRKVVADAPKATGQRRAGMAPSQEIRVQYWIGR